MAVELPGKTEKVHEWYGSYATTEDGVLTKKTPETVKKLEEAFSMDCTIKEACLLANISSQTFHTWVKNDPLWKNRLDMLRETPVLLARKTVVEKISESYSNAIDYLKRKKKKEFGDHVEVEENKNINVLISSLKNVIEGSYESNSSTEVRADQPASQDVIQKPRDQRAIDPNAESDDALLLRLNKIVS